MEEGLVGEFCSSRQTGYFDFVQQLGEKTRKRRPMRVSPPRYEGGTRFSLRSNLVVSPPRELYLCSFWPNLTKSAFSQTRYTDSVLASLEPRLFHSKLIGNTFTNEQTYLDSRLCLLKDLIRDVNL